MMVSNAADCIGGYYDFFSIMQDLFLRGNYFLRERCTILCLDYKKSFFFKKLIPNPLNSSNKKSFEIIKN